MVYEKKQEAKTLALIGLGFRCNKTYNTEDSRESGIKGSENQKVPRQENVSNKVGTVLPGSQSAMMGYTTCGDKPSVMKLGCLSGMLPGTNPPGGNGARAPLLSEQSWN